MAIPGRLDLEIFNPQTMVITAEAAIDPTQVPPQLILRDKPKDTFPTGGVLRIVQETDYAVGKATDPATAELILAGEIAGDGIYELLKKNPSLETKYAATLEAANVLADIAVYAGSHTFETLNEDFETYQIQFFQDTVARISYHAIVTNVQKKIDVSNGNADIISSTVTVELYRISNQDVLERIFQALFRPFPVPSVYIAPPE
jgi:hypothetical protein